MAAYGALVSLSNILHQILHPPPAHHYINIPREQIESLQQKVGWLMDFLETYSGRRIKAIENLEARIADAAYAAEDIIESNVVSRIREKRATDEAEGSACLDQSIMLKGINGLHSMVRKFGQIKYKNEIRRMIKEFHSIEKELVKVKDKESTEDVQLKSITAATSSRRLPSGKITLVGFDKHVNEIMDALATDESNRQIIPVVGMGGIGKTTLATAVYNNPFIVEHFHVRAWVTISQEYAIRELLLRLLSEINKACSHGQEATDDELGLQPHKELFDRRYLVVLDDMWNIQAWEMLKMFLPHNDNGSRILVTTRLSNLADDFGSCTPYKMDFLDEVQSWDLLRKKIFADEDCPVELEDIGKTIAQKCRGLPLALVVIGGLLAKFERTREHWESVAANVTSALNYGNDEQLSKILLSYIHLSVYIKPCFLYLAMFPEDAEIRVSTLVRLWVAEGLIKATQAKFLEEVAHEYLEDLISRNLILVHKRGSSGKVRLCKIHDLVRDLCIIQAEKEKFLCIAKIDSPNISPSIKTMRRLSIYVPQRPKEITAALRSTTLNRSWLSHGDKWSSMWEPSMKRKVDQIIHGFRLLKVVHYTNDAPMIKIDISKLSNLRYVLASNSISSVLSISMCWNLQTLDCWGIDALPAEIWQMPQLRHLKAGASTLPDPPDDQNVIVLENLQTLNAIRNFKCTEQVLERIPNPKKLSICYPESSDVCKQVGNHGLKNLARFKKLESLRIDGVEILWKDIAFPISLKKLTLWNFKIPWEQLSIVGSLPNLEVLKLQRDATRGEEWNPIAGQFCRLKFLLISCWNLKIWGAEDSHFPCLEHLLLVGIQLREIPMSFAEILTLQVIELRHVEDSVWSSAREISEQREHFGYEPLQLREAPAGKQRHQF